MKRLIFSVLTVFAVGSISFANPTIINDDDEGIIVNIKKVEAKTIKLLLANLEQESTKISIQDQSGTTYFKSFVNNHNGYSQKIHLDKMPLGKYLFEVKNDSQRVIYVMVVRESGIIFSSPTLK